MSVDVVNRTRVVRATSGSTNHYTTSTVGTKTTAIKYELTKRKSKSRDLRLLFLMYMLDSLTSASTQVNADISDLSFVTYCLTSLLLVKARTSTKSRYTACLASLDVQTFHPASTCYQYTVDHFSSRPLIHV